MKSINEYIKDNKLPNISEAEYQRICAQLGIDYNGMDQKISLKDFVKLINSAEINKYLLEQNAKFLNDESNKEYGSILKEARSQMLDANRKGFTEEVSAMNSDVSDIKNLRNAGNNAFNNRQNTIVVDDSMLNAYQKNKLASLDSRITKVDEKLKKKYQEQLRLKKELKNSRTKYKKNITQKRLDRISKRIVKMQQKQGKLMGEQRKISTMVAIKYKEVRKRQIEEYKRSIATSKLYINALEKIEKSKSDIVNDINLTTSELTNPNLNKFKKVALNIDKIKLEREKNKLEKEKNRIEKLRQFQTRLNGLKRKTPARGTEEILNSITISYA